MELVRGRRRRTLSRMMARCSRVRLLVCLCLAATSCGGSTSAPTNTADTAARETMAMDARIRGTWRLTDFRPEVPLEPTLAGFLTLQLQTMAIRFEGGRLQATSPTMRADLAYRIVEAGGPMFKISLTKEGVDYLSSCRISDNNAQIDFRAETSPWRGTGTLVRVSR